MTQSDILTHARFELDPYTQRVLDVIKGEHGLKTRNEALRKFVELHGPEHTPMRIDEQILAELDNVHDEHMRKHGFETMDRQELDRILGL